MARPLGSEEAARRKQLGAWYTPAELVDHLVSMTIPPGHLMGSGAGSVTVLDPSCGDGRFLAAAARVFGDRARLCGVDVDPNAVRAARLAVPGAEVVCADALALDWGDRRFDVVLGNPPFLNQMARDTTRGGSSRFGGGPYANAAAEFLALAVSLARPETGRVGLVLPQSVLTTRDAGPIRADVLERAALVHAWWSPTRMFDASVRTCALVFAVGVPQGMVDRAYGPGFDRCAAVELGRSWGALMSDGSGDDRSVHDESSVPTLGSIASFTVDFRDQYYGLVDAVGDDVDGPPLVTSGLIEPGRCLWGEREVRFAKRRFVAPRVDVGALSPKLQRWAAQRLVPKILIANQTRTIEAVVDRAGEWLPSVPVITCTTAELDRVAAVLASDRATAWVRHHAAGSGLSANSVRLSPALLSAVPLFEG